MADDWQGCDAPVLIHPALPQSDRDITALVLNLGCGKHPIAGCYNIDQVDDDGVDWVVDLAHEHLELPFEEGRVDGVFGSHVIEHIANPLPLMAELYRVCRPDARLVFRCPYGGSDDAWENPTHVRPYYVGSWAFFGQPHYWREDYGYRADWVVESVELVLEDGVLDLGGITADDLVAAYRRVRHERNVVAEQAVVLRCNKPARDARRELQTGHDVVLQVKRPVDAWSYETVEVGRLRVGGPGDV